MALFTHDLTSIISFDQESYNECQIYIATQAPMENTVGDFWRMIWEQRSTIVVMLDDSEGTDSVSAEGVVLFLR